MSQDVKQKRREKL